MKKNATRVLAMFLALLLAMAALPLGALAEGPYTITFYPNGGKGAEKTVSTKADGSYVIGFPADYGIQAEEEFVFIGWNGSEKGDATWHQPGEKVTLKKDWPQYAQWAPVEETVTFRFLPGMETETVMPDRSVRKNTKFTLPENEFEREGYHFTAWLGSDGQSYTEGQELTREEGLSFTAQWAENAPQTVTVVFDDGLGNTVEQQLTVGVETALRANSFTREGSHFTGWNTAADGSGAAYADGQTVSLSAGLTLYAQWQADETPTPSDNTDATPKTPVAHVSLSREGLADLEQALNQKCAELGVQRQQAQNAAYYVWCLWDDVLEDKLTADEISAESAKGSLSFTLPFTDWLALENNRLLVYRFDAASGQLITAQGTQTDTGVSFAAPLSTEQPGIYVLLTVPAPSAPTEPTTTPDFTVNFDPNGGSGTQAPITKPETEIFTAPACTFTAPANKRFVKWSTHSDGTGDSYVPEQTIAKNLELHELTLFAVWEDIPAAPAALTGTVRLTGKPNPGEVLSAELVESNNTGELRYQWLKDGAPIEGATGQSYTVKNGDLNAALTCRVSSSVQTGSRTSSPVTVFAVTRTPGVSTPVRDNSVPDNKIAALMQQHGSSSGVKAEVYNVEPCWDNNPNAKMTAKEIQDAVKANGAIVFLLPYPAGTTAKGYAFHVYHYNAATGTSEKVSSEAVADGLRVRGTSFSPFIVLAVPSAPSAGNVLIVGSAVVGGTLTVACGEGVSPTGFQWTRNGVNIVGATAATYKVTNADVGQKIACNVSTASATVPSIYVVPTAAITPKVDQGVFNDGETATGVISGVSTGMQYIRAADYNAGSTAWRDVSGDRITGLKKGGLYYIRLRNDTDSRSWARIDVPEYYSVRVYEVVKGTRYVDGNGESAPRHGSFNPKATVEAKGSSLRIAITPNKNYAVQSVLVNGKSISFSRYNSGYVAVVDAIDARTNVDVQFVYTGSSPRTGDDSHLGAWSALAALSLLGMAAALTLLKKKNKI